MTRPSRSPGTVRAYDILPDDVAVAIRRLRDAIDSLPGKKIITIAVTDDCCHAFDVDEAGCVGYESDHDHVLNMLIATGMWNGGGVMVRQFVPGDGVRRCVYGVGLGDGGIVPMTADQTCRTSCYDILTGTSLPPEPGVEYCELKMSNGSVVMADDGIDGIPMPIVDGAFDA